ncbi:MAG: nitroreductase family protein, partial [Lacinutrix sp.]|uniref:nitroreductase family protein n=1 Tax=Lacinutrix sp. TaxID=1937692 RepID=UPI0030A70200
RVYEDTDIDTEKVKQCIYNASLAPTSSNLQLWEFYHVTDTTKLKALAKACFNQSAAKTAKQLVIVVARKDLWKQRAKANISFLNSVYSKPDLSKREEKRKKMATDYYKKLIPTIYTDLLGILGQIKYFTFQVIGLFKPIYRQVRSSDMRIVAHKSAGLAAENFMLSMSEINYDTCPMEGSDSLKVKQILGLPRSAEINMVISCGIRKPEGVYGPRFRIPFEEVYFKV